MAPPPAVSIIAGIAKRETRNMLSTLTCMIRRQSATRGIDDGAASADPDIVVQEVEPAEPGECGIDDRAALRLVGHVGDERHGDAALSCDHRDGLVGGL